MSVRKSPIPADLKTMPIGTRVVLVSPGLPDFETTTRCIPYQIPADLSNAGMWVVFVEGRTGYYSLRNVRMLAKAGGA